MEPMRRFVAVRRVLYDALGHFNTDDGWSMASHLAIRAQPQHDKLSERELQVMKLIAEGKSLKEIAQKLSLNAKTVSTYRTRVLEKMRLQTNADLTRYMVERRLQF